MELVFSQLWHICVCKEKFHEFTQSVMDEIDIMAATQHQAAQDYLLLEEPEFRREMKLYLHF